MLPREATRSATEPSFHQQDQQRTSFGLIVVLAKGKSELLRKRIAPNLVLQPMVELKHWTIRPIILPTQLTVEKQGND